MWARRRTTTGGEILLLELEVLRLQEADGGLPLELLVGARPPPAVPLDPYVFGLATKMSISWEKHW
jgi:hypothetical protein